MQMVISMYYLFFVFFFPHASMYAATINIYWIIDYNQGTCTLGKPSSQTLGNRAFVVYITIRKGLQIRMCMTQSLSYFVLYLLQNSPNDILCVQKLTRSCHRRQETEFIFLYLKLAQRFTSLRVWQAKISWHGDPIYSGRRPGLFKTRFISMAADEGMKGAPRWKGHAGLGANLGFF